MAQHSIWMLVWFLIFQGIRTSIVKNPIFFIFQGGRGGSGIPLPSRSWCLKSFICWRPWGMNRNDWGGGCGANVAYTCTRRSWQYGSITISPHAFIPIFRKAYRCPRLFWLSPLLKKSLVTNRRKKVTKRINGNLFNLLMFCTAALEAQQRIDSLEQCFLLNSLLFFLFLKMCYLV